MISKQVLLRHIGLIVALLLALTPLVQVHSQDVPRNKTLIIGFEGGPAPAPENQGLNATAASFNSGTNQIMVENLWILNYQTGKSDPWLASGPEKWNSDFTEVDIPLRDGITWNDGKPFTADDIVFSLNMYKAHPTLKFAGPIADEVKDHIWEGQDPETFTNFDLAKGWPVWTGPYRMVKASAGEFDYDLNPDWGGAKTGFQKLPAPQRVVFVDAGPADRKAAALAANEVDGEPQLDLQLLHDIQAKNPAIIGWTKEEPGAWIDPCPAELGFNTQVAPWDDAQMRWAVNYALPKQKIADASSGGFGELSSYNFPDYPALQSWLTENKDLFEKYDVNTFDPAKAKKIIEGKGYTMGSDGFYAKDGKKLSVDVLVKSADTNVTPVVIAALQDIGIDAAPRKLVDASYFQARNVGDFQIETTHVNCGSVTEPYAELYTLHSKWIKPAGQIRSNNVWGWKNAEYDAIVDKIGKLPPNDPEEHKLFRQALELRLKELPLISLNQQKRLVPYSTKYWTNWATAENGYVHPPNWWATFIIQLVNIKPAL